MLIDAAGNDTLSTAEVAGRMIQEERDEVWRLRRLLLEARLCLYSIAISSPPSSKLHTTAIQGYERADPDAAHGEPV